VHGAGYPLSVRRYGEALPRQRSDGILPRLTREAEVGADDPVESLERHPAASASRTSRGCTSRRLTVAPSWRWCSGRRGAAGFVEAAPPQAALTLVASGTQRIRFRQRSRLPAP